MNNFLKVSQYDAFAQFVVDYMKMVKDSTGVDPYAISPQNEPYFHQPYNSCVYSGDGLSTITTKIGEKLQAAGLSTRLFGAEHMLWDGTNVYRALVSNQHLHAFAVHGYTDGVTADHGNADSWSNLKNNVQSKELWMTETTTPTGLVQAGRGLHQAFQSGKVSLWTWWAYADELGTYTQTDGINTTWRPNNAYWATSHYARFIRPGAVSVGATASSGSVWSTAFKNPDNTWAVVLVNTGSAATVSVSGAGLPAT